MRASVLSRVLRASRRVAAHPTTRAVGVGAVAMLAVTQYSRVVPRCDAPVPELPPPGQEHPHTSLAALRKTRKNKRRTMHRDGQHDHDSEQVTLDVMKDALEEVKKAQKLVGPMKRETLMALMTLLVRDSLTPAGSRPLPPSNVVSPAVSAYQARPLAEDLLEYAQLCDAVYDLEDHRNWPELLEKVKLGAESKGDKLLWSHSGGVCIPRHVVIRDDGGKKSMWKRRKRRILVVVRGTAEMSDAAINVAMVPEKYRLGNEEHYSHRGIVEAATFLVRVIRPVIWRALDELRQEGVSAASDTEIVFTGHSLGGATASIAALELQNEFGPRIPVRAIGFATPASLSASLANSPKTKAVVTTIVCNDDIIPRFCTKNLRSLRLKAEEVKVHQEVLGMAKQLQDMVAQRTDELTDQIVGMVKLPTSKDLPEKVATGLEGIADLQSLRGAFQRMIGWVFPKSGPKDAVQDEKKKSMLAQMAREYQEALDAEIQTVQDKLDRSKWGALGSWLGGAKQKEAEEASNSLQAELQRLLKDKSSVASDFTVEAERRLRHALTKGKLAAADAIDDVTEAIDDVTEKLSESGSEVVEEISEAIEDVTEALTGTAEKLLPPTSPLQQKLDELKRQATKAKEEATRVLQEQIGAVGPEAITRKIDETTKHYTQVLKEKGLLGGESPAPSATEANTPKAEAPSVTPPPSAPVMVPATSAAEQEDVENTVGLYPPGQVIWLRAVPEDGDDQDEEDDDNVQYDMHRVKDLSFFDEIMLSRTMFTDHLLSSYLAALRDVATTGSRTRTKTKKK